MIYSNIRLMFSSFKDLQKKASQMGKYATDLAKDVLNHSSYLLDHRVG